MKEPPIEPSVAIGGGGAVGLFLALALAHRGNRVNVFEKREEPRVTSRSIGIHPPSLEALAELSLDREFVERGLHVEHAEARSENGMLGEIDFAVCAPPFRYVLTLPQDQTEAILRRAAERSDRISLERATAVSVAALPDRASLRLSRADGTIERRDFSAAVGCDGKHGAMRRSLGIELEGARYPGGYAMADFPDRTSFGAKAIVFLGREGLLESFPLPGGIRRWVARCDVAESDAARAIVQCVQARARVTLDEGEATHASTFHAERFIARTFSRGRVALAGDAAHSISPIGGQGMNLGWLGARSLARVLSTALRRGDSVARALARDAERRRSMALIAARRAELNMWLGRPTKGTPIRDGLVGLLLGSPAQHVLARMFTMRGLDLGFV
ncbi:NAD(P)/FAD-dependent oxidoreductase [soil metagenome]